MLPLRNITVDEAFTEAVSTFPDRPALVYEGRRWSYKDLDADIDLMAKRFLSLGVRKGTHVGVLCEAQPNAIISIFALNRIGAIAVLFNTSLKRAELRTLVRTTDVEVLLIGDGYREVDFRDECYGFLEGVRGLREAVYIGLDGDARGYRTLADTAPEQVSDEELLQCRRNVRPEDGSFILFTSGTTSLPKAVQDSQYSRANMGLQQARDLSYTEEDRVCTAMPVFHCFSLSVNVMATLFTGACLCLPKSRHTGDLLTLIQNEHCTVFSTVPALFDAILRREDFDDWDLSSLRTGFIGGSLCPPDLFEEIEHRFGYLLLSSLGQTEATAGITTAFASDSLAERAGTVGHVMEHMELRLAKPGTNDPVEPGESGEICIRGYNVMKGYYNDPESTAAALTADGWLHTGDMAYLNEAGNLVLTGRMKELIIRGGENISPLEIESVLRNDPSIADCKAVGVPDRHYGEEIALCVVPAEGYSQENVLTTLRASLAYYKVPRYIFEVNTIPKTATGKIRSEELRVRAIEMMKKGD
ncbi:MAG: AMP-binding protein [Clostridia bacterium]|nr:AMP-binding protein [Clostridia bacterium]